MIHFATAIFKIKKVINLVLTFNLFTNITPINPVFHHTEASFWQMGFQDPATPIAARIIEIHHHVFFFLLIVAIFVIYKIFIILVNFALPFPNTIPVRHRKYLNRLGKRLVPGARRGFIRRLTQVNFTHDTTIEIIWTFIPSIILILIAIPSFGLLYAMDDIMDPEITLKAIGNQWYWNYEYNDYVATEEDWDDDLIPIPGPAHQGWKDEQFIKFGLATRGPVVFDSYMIPEDELSFGYLRLLEVDNTVVLPINVFIRVHVTSTDVLHSWAVPSLGVKVDAVPHRINSTFIYLERPGTFYGQCSEICGVNHGFMPIVIKGVELDSYMNWINKNSSRTFVPIDQVARILRRFGIVKPIFMTQDEADLFVAFCESKSYMTEELFEDMYHYFEYYCFLRSRK